MFVRPLTILGTSVVLDRQVVQLRPEIRKGKFLRNLYIQLVQEIRKGKFSQNLFLQAPRLLVDLVEVQELVKTAAPNLGELHKGPCAKG